jgi:hypothetical protein
LTLYFAERCLKHSASAIAALTDAFNDVIGPVSGMRR